MRKKLSDQLYALLPGALRNRRNAAILAAVLLVFAVGGVFLIQRGLADTFLVASEAEDGTMAGKAGLDDPAGGASNGKAVRFGTSDEIPTLKTDILLSGLANVWDIVFLPTSELIFNERKGTVSILKDGQAVQIAAISDVDAGGEGGLLGMAVDPQFTQNRFLYTCLNSTAGDVRVVRWKLADDMTALQDRLDIVTGMTANPSGRHSGCRMTFGPDGYLWIGTGDSATGAQPQQPQSLNGKILRVDRDGKAAAGNLGEGFDDRIYSYGHRNTQGIAFFPSPKSGAPGVLGLSAEHGSTLDDEVNELRKGNFGWAPPEGYNESGVPMTDKTRFPDAVEAIWSSGSPAQAPSGMAIINGTKWKGWNGAAAVAMLRAKHLKILRLDEANKVTKEERVLDNTHGRLRDATLGPDGNLYISTDNSTDDKILRLTPQ